MANYPFHIEFLIFDPTVDSITSEQKAIRDQLICTDLHTILQTVFKDDDRYKYLKRAEPSLSSLDERKQLRLRSMDFIYNKIKKYQYSLDFTQLYSFRDEYFTLDELNYITRKIQGGLEGYLGYDIPEPMLYIKMSNML